MLINAIRAENLKNRHSNMWVAVLILPLLDRRHWCQSFHGINSFCNYI